MTFITPSSQLDNHNIILTRIPTTYYVHCTHVDVVSDYGFA